MKRIPCLLLKMVAAIVFIAAIHPVAQAVQTSSEITLWTFYGPEVFTRGEGEPITETRFIPTLGYEGPFVLHLQNGEANGKNRVSSATINLDGEIVLYPNDFSQQIADLQREIQLSEYSLLTICLNSAPGSKFTLWIEGRPKFVVEPEGGRLTFPNGIVLDIPAGAVSEPTPIQISELFQEEIEPILQSYGQVGKYFAGGFEGKPNGLTFNAPIKAIIPVHPRKDSGDVPMLFAVNVIARTYSVVSSNLLFDPVSSTVSVEIQHFSSWVIAFGEDMYEEYDCRIDPSDCHCRTILVEVNEEEIWENQCNEQKAIGLVTFVECGGAQQNWTLREWQKPTIDITPSPLNLELHQTAPLNVTLTNAEGKQLSANWVNWSSSDPEVSVSPVIGATTNVTALKSGSFARVWARSGCGNENFVQVNIGTPGVFRVDLAPLQANLCQDSLVMKASPKFADGSTIPGQQINWSMSPAGIAKLLPVGGTYNAILRGTNDNGQIATVWATVGGVSSIPANIRIGGLASLWISPANLTLSIGQTQQLTVRGRDYCGNLFELIPVDWIIPPGGIISFDPFARTVTAVTPGTATLTTVFGGKSASVQTTVRGSGSASFAGSLDVLIQGSIFPVSVSGTLSSSAGTGVVSGLVTFPYPPSPDTVPNDSGGRYTYYGILSTLSLVNNYGAVTGTGYGLLGVSFSGSLDGSVLSGTVTVTPYSGSSTTSFVSWPIVGW